MAIVRKCACREKVHLHSAHAMWRVDNLFTMLMTFQWSWVGSRRWSCMVMRGRVSLRHTQTSYLFKSKILGGTWGLLRVARGTLLEPKTLNSPLQVLELEARLSIYIVFVFKDNLSLLKSSIDRDYLQIVTPENRVFLMQI